MEREASENSRLMVSDRVATMLGLGESRERWETKVGFFSQADEICLGSTLKYT